MEQTLDEQIKQNGYHPEIVAKDTNEQIEITAYVNDRGTVSGIKTLGFNPITLKVHENYRILGAAGKAVFRQNAYIALQNDSK